MTFEKVKVENLLEELRESNVFIDVSGTDNIAKLSEILKEHGFLMFGKYYSDLTDNAYSFIVWFNDKTFTVSSHKPKGLNSGRTLYADTETVNTLALMPTLDAFKEYVIAEIAVQRGE